jgi:Papain-like cysteine protease AvrRpt2
MYLDVPFVSQLDYGGSLHLDDPTGCWYSSACMVAFAFEAGPRQGIPELYSMSVTQADGTVTLGHWAMDHGWLWVLKRNEHLADLDGGMPATAADLAEALRKWGPLIMFWEKTHGGQTYGHASVIIGVRGDTVIVHDPENAPHSEMSFADTTAKLLAGWPMLKRDALPFSYGAAVRS